MKKKIPWLTGTVIVLAIIFGAFVSIGAGFIVGLIGIVIDLLFTKELVWTKDELTKDEQTKDETQPGLRK